MPEMRFTVEWPDGQQESCYSPSLVIRELLTTGESYPVYEFMERTGAALRIASGRVRAKFGFYCSAAADQLKQLEEQAARFASEDRVRVIDLGEAASREAGGAPKPTAQPAAKTQPGAEG